MKCSSPLPRSVLLHINCLGKDDCNPTSFPVLSKLYHLVSLTVTNTNKQWMQTFSVLLILCNRTGLQIEKLYLTKRFALMFGSSSLSLHLSVPVSCVLAFVLAYCMQSCSSMAFQEYDVYWHQATLAATDVWMYSIRPHGL